MQERANKFKPVSKKVVPPPTIMNQDNSLNQESKLSSNSQNKLFIRKPVLKRNGFVSPSFAKNRVSQNEEVKSPIDLYKSKMCIRSDGRSDQDYWQGKDKTGFGTILALKKYIMTHQTEKNQLLNSTKNSRMALEVYYGNQSHALTQIGEHYKIQAIQIDDSQKDSHLKQKMWKNSKQNIVANGLSTKKVTRTEYFANPNTDEARPTTSRSLKEKQLNFNLLRHSVNNNIEAYAMSLEDNIRKLQKSNYAINNKCKWMHEEIEMHLEKQHLIATEKNGLELELQAKYKEIKILEQEKSHLQKQLAQLKIQLQKKESSKSDKSFKDLQTISSLKQLCSKAEQTNFTKTSKVQQKLQAYFGIMPSSIDKSKKKSFRTYPGVCSPRKSKDEGSKCSSIAGNNESFQDFTQSSILCQKSNIKSQMTDSKCLIATEELRKQRDQLKATVESINLEIKILKEKNQEKVNQKNQQLQKKLYQLQQKYENLQCHLDEIKNQKQILLMEIDKIKQKNLTQIQSLTTKIKELEDQISLYYRTSIHSADQKLQEENPLRYFLQNIDKNYGYTSQAQSIQQENKSLRVYIQKIIEQCKYMKIENHMLLKVKQEKEMLEKEKKKIKEERDSFKKKLLDLVKNSKNIGKQPTKSCRRIMDFGSDSSEEEESAVFQLSKSEIKLHQQSEFEKVQK